MISKKEQRSIDFDLRILKSTKNYTYPKNIEEFKSFDFLSPSIKLDNRELFLNDKSKSSLKRICDIIYNSHDFQGTVSYNDIYQEALKKIQCVFTEENDDQDFVDSVISKIEENQVQRTLFCKIAGITFKGIETLNLNCFSIEKYNQTHKKIINDSFSYDPDIGKLINKEYEGSIIIKSTIKGTKDSSEEEFYAMSSLVLSAIWLYSAIICDGNINNTNIILCNHPAYGYSPASTISYSDEETASFTRHLRVEQNVELTNEILEYLKVQCFFDKMFELLCKENRTQLEDAIAKAVYWFGEAAKEKNNSLCFMKLWTCAESLFSLTSDEITEKNAQGISIFLVAGGYSIYQPNDYEDLKSKIKKLYKFRSKIIHRGKHDNIAYQDRSDFTKMISWIIIIATSLIDKGYTKLDEIESQTKRMNANLTNKEMATEGYIRYSNLSLNL